MENKFVKFFDFCNLYKEKNGKSVTQEVVDLYSSKQKIPNEIFLGKLPTMVQGEEPLGEELIAKLEKYAEDYKLPSYGISSNEEGNFIAKAIK